MLEHQQADRDEGRPRASAPGPADCGDDQAGVLSIVARSGIRAESLGNRPKTTKKTGSYGTFQAIKMLP
jgi:hypothetical protein